MNFAGLQQAIQNFEEVMAIGKEVYVAVENGGGNESGAKERKICHIAGMTRAGNQARMYVLTENVPDRERSLAVPGNTNRERMKIHTEPEFFMEIAAVKIGETELKTRGITGYRLGQGMHSQECLDYNCGEVLLFAELFKAGWKIPETSPFAWKNWEELWVTHIDFELAENVGAGEAMKAGENVTAKKPENMSEDLDSAESVNMAMPAKRLPSWENQEVSVRLGKRSRTYLVEKPVCLMPGKETEISFSLEDGRGGICYINRVYPIDVWQENEEKFKDPRYLEIMTEEELKKHKEEFFEGLAFDCPKGMCYLGIEYECTLNGNLVFYDRGFLDRKPEENKGSARIMMMLLKPDEPVGKHGRRQYGCVIQTPVLPDTKQMEAELFWYVDMLEEKEVRLEFENV